ncbi:MAG TPA: four helix bundle protein [Candidatus Kapabacteria bacterium]
MSEIKNFKDLIVWQRSMQLVTSVYEVTSKYPKEELYGLMSQSRRCSVSIPSNIAEGHKRGTRKDYRNFLTFSRGSLAELETQLLIANNLKYIELGSIESMLQEIEEISKMLTSLINKLAD